MMTTPSPLHPSNLLRLLRELVRFRTVNPPGGEEPAARFVERELRGIGCETVVVPYADDGVTAPSGKRPSRAHVVGRLRGSGERPGLMLSGHLDVVPPGAVPWAFDPFAGEVVEGRHSWLLADPDAFGSILTNSIAVAKMARQLEDKDHEEGEKGDAGGGLARRLARHLPLGAQEPASPDQGNATSTS